MEDSSRRSAHEIFEKVIENAREELARSTSALLFSGFVAGICMGLTGLSVALALSYLGNSPPAQFVSFCFYPIGFIVVIVGRAQLFTENTLFPVALALDERGHVLNTLRLWAVVFAANVVGAVFFGWLVMKTGALPPNFADALAGLGTEAAQGHFTLIFAKAVLGGWLIALVAWMVTASHWTIGQIAIVWMITFIVGAGRFSHCIASSAEIVAAIMSGHLHFSNYFAWLLPATLGNIVGGVFMVSVLNYGQVRLGGGAQQGDDAEEQEEGRHAA
ncbi:MAG: formate/nitrite transporter family protein [Acidobacteria bacterium]|nr:formate/nitrite transporter family protein [Acidobacteriota bacterium]MBV9145510.1 formate/nitrite transporter family protein [Acidobacteriota bacterium]